MVLALVLDDELETRSKSLFGNRHMLHVARDIASRRGPFTVKDVSTRTGVPYSSTHRLIRHLESVGLLEPTPGASSEQHRWYERASHKFWGAVQQLCGANDDKREGEKGVQRARSSP